MGSVRIKRHWDAYHPLETIPKEDWKEVIWQKANFARSALQGRLDQALEILDELERNQVWEIAGTTKDNFFRNICGIPADELPKVRAGYALLRGRGEACDSADQAISAQAERAIELAEDRSLPPLPPALTHAEAGALGGRGRKARDNITGFERGTSAPYLVARMKRDRPDIIERMQRGEFRSVRAAAREAGIVREQTDLEKLWLIWSKSSLETKAAFLEKVKDQP